jgi:geranylgeranylglycerol-phosphate geranylgeranyltransferase
LSIGTIVLAGAVAASPLPFILGTFDVIYLLLVGPADAIMLYACYESLEDPTAAQSHLKYGMFLAAAAFVVGRTAVIL